MNTQINEDFVSFEVAKLLKDKGFNEPCIATYNLITKDFKVEETYLDWTTHWDAYVSAPTLQMAMKWLREEKNIFIDIYYDEDIKGYMYSIIKLTKGTTLNVSDLAHNTYEEACEAAIKYCLTNLI